jgi:hypothetical protein
MQWIVKKQLLKRLSIKAVTINMRRTAKKTNIAYESKSIKLMRKSAGWCDDVLADILTQVF